MNLTPAEVARVISWARAVFVHTNEPWTVADDDLLAKLQGPPLALGGRVLRARGRAGIV